MGKDMVTITKNSILLIDDEPDITFTIKNILEDNGFKVDSFTDPITALKSYRSNFYDVVICSLVLEHIEDLFFIFSEAYRILKESGEFFINEYHPYKQYQGKKAFFQKNGKKVDLESYVHDVSEFITSN